jgi:A/G-specific adenine glycosylase
MNVYTDFHQRLHAWYQAQGRHHLPWRKTTNPYHIWLSEVMLQQTQVQTVLERFYFPFLERFPTIESLAEADLQEVLKLWQGLGYYNRAKNLHKAAQFLAHTPHKLQSSADAESQSKRFCNAAMLHAECVKLPKAVEELQTLPGIGRNTAHAIAAFAYHQPVAVMEANLKRVLCRIFALKAPTEAILWEKAAALLDTQNPFDYNQAMMDLGAMLCTPEAPQCLLCPASEICAGKTAPRQYSPKKSNKAIPVRKQKIVVFRDVEGRIAITPREGKFLHGLWQFAEYPDDATEAYFENIAYPFQQMVPLGAVSHAYTHFRLEAEVLLQAITAYPQGKTSAEILNLPLSRTEEKIIKLLTKHYQ